MPYASKEKKAEYQKKYREKNKERISELGKEYREKNKEKINKYHKKYYERNKERINECWKEYSQRRRDDINDAYIKRLISGRTSLRAKDIPDSLISAYRASIKLKRAIKNDN